MSASDENASAPAAAPEPAPPPSGLPSAEEKQWALFAHLSALIGAIFTSVFFGFGCFVGPLVIWLIKKDTMPFVNDQGKEAVNFNITLAIISAILLILTVMTLGLGIVIALPVGFIVGVGWLIFTIIAAIKASEGVAYRYPISLRLIK